MFCPNLIDIMFCYVAFFLFISKSHSLYHHYSFVYACCAHRILRLFFPGIGASAPGVHTANDKNVVGFVGLPTHCQLCMLCWRSDRPKALIFKWKVVQTVLVPFWYTVKLLLWPSNQAISSKVHDIKKKKKSFGSYHWWSFLPLVWLNEVLV